MSEITFERNLKPPPMKVLFDGECVGNILADNAGEVVWEPTEAAADWHFTIRDIEQLLARMKGFAP